MHPVMFLVSLGLLLGALLLAVTTSLSLEAAARCLGKWVRWPIAIAVQAVALFSLSALAWSAIGYWVGDLGRPISSLMPAQTDLAKVGFATQLAQMLWWWIPPIFLLALPLTALLLAARLVGHRPGHVQVLLAGLPGIVWLAVVEDAFHMPGVLARIIPALHSPQTPSILMLLWPALLLAFVWWTVVFIWPRSPLPYQPSALEKIREGALAIGLSPDEVWKRHLLQPQLRQFLADLCSIAAIGMSLWISLGCPGNVTLSAQMHQALSAALDDPQAPLRATLPYMLCALSLWLLGRIIQPRLR
ncbi:hypothetical protein EI77_00991 [Prosthecobacter fusiformis]|uniref:Uncharacterized protein n=1 Tax=Prosthecobacter fusiformis TaxID=48464 RepID=A0A4R7SRD6_9BACT|nr:hypothetical protein [Prosthecobacter fusiformis]TDU81681.1 hypothetical protein EI77_00991 [Prosthecobacter fusiformis]